MTIPYPQKYMAPELGIGKLANYQNTQADSKAVGTNSIKFGQAVQVTESIAAPYTTGNFFGVALAKNYVDEIKFNDDKKTGEYRQGEMVAVLRKGSIWVQVDEDVKEGEYASVKATGNFGSVSTAEDSTDKPIGIFQTSAQAGSLAILQINLP